MKKQEWNVKALTEGYSYGAIDKNNKPCKNKHRGQEYETRTEM
jgi:hypothetical protein